MTTENTYTKSGYVFMNLLYALLLSIGYHNLVFKTIDGMSYNSSRVVLIALVATSTIFGIIGTINRKRTGFSLFMNLIIPFGIYSVISYMPVIPTLIAAVLQVTLVLVIIAVTLVIKKNNALIFLKLRRSAYCCKAIVAVGLTVLVLMIALSSQYNLSLFAPSVGAVNPADGNDETIAANIETVVKLDEDTWETLSLSEKEDVIQTVANVEANYLGLSHELNVCTGVLGYTTLGCYDDSKHLIIINIDHMEYASAHEVLDTVCHEARHAYQHELVEVYDDLSKDRKELMLFQEIVKYKEEFADYISGNEDFEEYYKQYSECDSRNYAKEAVEDYYARIDKYIF